jgi:gamma-glutamylcyclotransferase (GGCT)/AIG2-like uncharacterized protein YtfP
MGLSARKGRRTNQAPAGPLDCALACRYPASMPDAPSLPPALVPDLLFAYGTLRPSLAGAARQLVARLVPAGAATVRGLLYDLGGYPGMVAGDGIVHGELLQLSHPDQLADLDAYEECDEPNPLFRRELAIARRAAGEETTVWTYVYARSVTRASRIHGGDYLAHQRGR